MKMWGGKRTKAVLALILFIAIFSVSFFNVGLVSAATIEIHPSSYYNTTNISLNDQLQNIISSAKNGDTITFLGKYYGSISIIIDKSLNIISYINTTVSGDSTGNPVFIITGNGSKWTNITGFNIKSVNDGISVNNSRNVTVSKNYVSSSKGTGIKVSGSTSVKVRNNTVTSSQTGISVSNSENSDITGNNIKKSVNNGVEVRKSHDIKVSKNNITSSGRHGSSIASSENVIVEGNDIESNQNNGVNLIDTNNVIINNNTISKNNVHGIYFDKNVKNTQITNNIINNNLKYGIELFGSGPSTKINSNLIDGNAIGIDVNSATDNLDISQNIITNSKGFSDDSGVGINFGWGYIGSSTFSVNYNAIYGSQRREVCAYDSGTKVNFGYNWYGSDDPSQVRLCPYLTTKWITFQAIGLNGVYSAIFYAGDQVANLLPSFYITFQLNNGTEDSVCVINGTANKTYNSSAYQAHNNTVIIKAIFEKKEIKVSDDDVKNIAASQNNNNSGNGGNGNGGNSGNGNSGQGNGSGTNTGNGGNGHQGGNTGSGTSGPGVNQGQSGSTQSSDTSGTTTLVRNSAFLGGAGETSESSSSSTKTEDKKSKSAHEILLDNVNNPNLWSIVGLVLLIALIVVVYFRREIEMMYKK